MELELSMKSRGGVTSIRLSGQADLSSVPKLDKALRQALAMPHTTILIVDLNRLTFMDGATIGVLLKSQQQAHRQGSTFAICHAHGIAGDVLDVTGVRQLLEAHQRATT